MPKYTRNSGEAWTDSEIHQLRREALQNMPTRVMGLKHGRTVDAIYAKASKEGISLSPTNQSPYSRRK